MKKPLQLMRISLLSAALGLAATLSLPAQAATDEQLLPIQHQWAKIQYDLPEKERAGAFATLADVIEAARDKYPGDTELLIWQGIVVSSQAGAEGGLGALKLAKQARKLFEQAIKQNPAALNGSALTSLGTLYHKIPGWPLGFGDDKKAAELFKQALEISPDGLDTNYFYGSYLLDEGDRAAARAALQKALAAPPRPQRPKADAGRRQEVEQLLDTLS
ncbi:tetratricopeptide repeat protein [Marinobacterium lutimaris]|uniref:Tetratricopeptide repeat-containing protein n=1 Tax=Marinobacterium lutimaris TaxID=568106 RepID=A0A1H6AIV8_9GAMM|nr:hypothetical protein [Marinobacterium lutimaris]SEG48017.1 Tetratricopeptide repeat-containing protein [Marinobacterium lutimaris]